MEIRTTDTNRYYRISLRLWRNDSWNPGYEPDCFDELEQNIPRDYPREDGGCAYLMKEADLTAIVDWWQSEAENANQGNDGNGLCGLSPDEIENGDEWSFFCREE